MRNEHGIVSYAYFSLMRPQIASLPLVNAFIAFVCDTFQRHACLPAYLLTYLTVYLHSCLFASWPAFYLPVPPASLSACLPICLSACISTFILTYLHKNILACIPSFYFLAYRHTCPSYLPDCIPASLLSAYLSSYVPI